MYKKNITYLLLILLLTSLFYDEYWGLNALIGSFLFLIATIITSPKVRLSANLKSIRWWISIFLLIGNGYASFAINNQFCGILFLLSLFYFTSINHSNQHSLLLGIAEGFGSFFTGFYRLAVNSLSIFQSSEKDSTKKRTIRILVFFIPVMLFIVFLKLYQSADETFYEWTKFINLDWVSWGFIGLFIFLLIILFGLFHFESNAAIEKIEARHTNSIEHDYKDKVQEYIGLANENKIAKSILITLVLMLALYAFIDLKFITTHLYSPEADFRYAELIHEGIDALIFSIVLVIVIVTYLFRGQLNFTSSKTVKTLAVIWLLLNLIIVLTSGIKAMEYVLHWGMTYKRIGVFVYLTLAAIGLWFTLNKIIRIRSFWYLLRRTSLAFLICFTAMGFVNWDKHIAEFNLSLKPAQVDFEYIINLGEDSYPALVDYYVNHQQIPEIKSNWEIWNNFFHRFDNCREALKRKNNHSSWRSWVLREQVLLKKLNTYHLEYVKQGYRY